MSLEARFWITFIVFLPLCTLVVISWQTSILTDLLTWACNPSANVSSSWIGCSDFTAFSKLVAIVIGTFAVLMPLIAGAPLRHQGLPDLQDPDFGGSQ